MNRNQKIVFSAAAALAVVLLLLVFVPVLFRGPVTDRVRAELDDRVDARVTWSGVGIGVLRSFPNVSFVMNDFTIAGTDRFAADTLVSMRRFRLVLDAGSVIRNLRRGDPIILRSVELDRPALSLRVLEDGSTNWDILRERDGTAPEKEGRPFALSLRTLEIRDGNVRMDDRVTGLVASAIGIRQTLSGDFAAEQFVIRTRTTSTGLSVRFAGVPYLRNVRLEVDAHVDADMAAGRFKLGQNSVRLNALLLRFSGLVARNGERYTTDVKFEAPSTAFSEVLSLVPAVFMRDFASLQTTGTMSLAGQVKGDYGPEAFPAFALKLAVENGTFRYPDLPLPARDIFVDLSVENPGGDVDRTVVDLRRFHMVIGSRPVNGAFTMRTPVSDPDVDLRVAGSLDLADVKRTVKLEGVEELTGLLFADLGMRARISDMENERFDRVAARGRFDVARLALRSMDLPHAMHVDTAALRFTPRHAELAAFRGRIGRSDVQATGRLDNLIGYALRDQELRGRADVSSSYFDLNEWRSDDETMDVIPVPPRIDFTLQAAVARLTFADLEMSNARGGLRIHDRRVTLTDFELNTLGGRVTANGYYETLPAARPVFDMNLGVQDIDIPRAFTALTTIKVFAPVARYARGSVSADLRMTGALDPQMTPIFDALTARGGFTTAQLVLQDFPAMHKLADALKIPEYRNPGFDAVRASFEIRDGRLHVTPFDVRMGASRMEVAGSNGMDQTLDYSLKLEVPRAILGADANRAMATLVSRSNRAGVNLETAELITLGVKVSGPITSPSLATSFSDVTASAREQVERSVREEVDRRVDQVEERVDAAAEEARRRARAEADRIIAEAEERAERLRMEAQQLAEATRREGDEQADALLERASNPVARAAAQAGADRLRREAQRRADQIEREGDTRANGMVDEARRRADALVQP